MTGLVLATIVHASILASPDESYTKAFNTAMETGRPLVVLVGAEWCPACVQMKQSTMPQAEESGLLEDVAVAFVNTDQSPRLAHSLMRASSIPQLVMYHKTATGWRRHGLVGAQSLGTIESFVQFGVKETTAASTASTASHATE